MTPTLEILLKTFGLLGLASCLAWAAAATALLVGLVSRRRFQAWLAATGLAIVGLALAAATSESIRGIEVDRSAEVLAAEEAAKKSSQEKLRGRAAGIRFAEDTAADQADVAGVSVAEEQGAYERAVEERLAKIPSYRNRGKQRRSAKGGDASAAAQQPAGEAAADTKADAGTDEKPVGRMLPESQLLVADRYDRINRGVAWSLVSLAVGLVGLEYLRRFNSTFDAVWPLPLAGTWIDGAFAKSYVVDGGPPHAAGHDPLPEFLGRAVRKGESFVLFAGLDPLPDQDTLPRLAVGPFGTSLPKRSFAVADVEADPAIAEIVFESAWYGRGAFVLVGDAPAADAVLAGMVAMLVRRHQCRAVARRTVNIVWALPHGPTAAAMDELRYLCPQMNLRVIILPTRP